MLIQEATLLELSDVPAALSRHELLGMAGETHRGPLRPPPLSHLNSPSLWSSHTSPPLLQDHRPPRLAQPASPGWIRGATSVLLSSRAAPCSRSLHSAVSYTVCFLIGPPAPEDCRAPVGKTSLSPHRACCLARVCSVRDLCPLGQSLRGKHNALPSVALSLPASGMVRWGWEGCREIPVLLLSHQGHGDKGRSQNSRQVTLPQNSAQAMLLFFNWVFFGCDIVYWWRSSRVLSGKLTGASSDQGPAMLLLLVALVLGIGSTHTVVCL